MIQQKNSCIIISGGTRGLGLKLVEFCLDKGYSVVTFARKSTKEIENIITKNPENLAFIKADLSDVNSLKNIVEFAFQRFGIIYGLVNNAAIGQDSLLTHTKEEDIHKIILINLEAQIILTKYVIRKMLLQNTGGRIVNISSIAAARGYSGLTVYSAAKAGLEAFTRALSREVGYRGILINSISPGFFESEMSSVLSSEQLDTIRRRTPTQKLISADDIIPVFNLVMFENVNITGATFYVDGGASI